MTGWAVRAALAIGWWTFPIALGTLGAATVGLVKLGAWLGSLPGRARHKVRARYARRKHIRDLERMWGR